MSEKREKKRRYNQNLEYIADFNRWLNEEPPILRFVSWHNWKKPDQKGELNEHLTQTRSLPSKRN